MTHEIDLLLKGATVVDPVNGVNGVMDIGTAGTKICQIAEAIDPADANAVKYLEGCTIVPGIIDPHMHASSITNGHTAHRMLAKSGVITALDMLGPVDSVWDIMTRHGAGLNIASLQGAVPGISLERPDPTENDLKTLMADSVRQGALGLKILGGHFPLTPDSTAICMDVCQSQNLYCGMHAGTTQTGSNLTGVIEAVELSGGRRLHLAHINGYCRGMVKDALTEAMEAARLIESCPHIFSESYLSPNNGLPGAMTHGKPASRALALALEKFGFTADHAGMKQAIIQGKASILVESGGEMMLKSGPDAAAAWEEAGTALNASFKINPADSVFHLATCKDASGRFCIDAFSSDGGGFPRNVIVESGLALVAFHALTMAEFVVKTAVNPAAMLGLTHKGHLGVGADADITVLDRARQKACMGIAMGQVIMVEGHVCGRQGTAIVLPEGRNWVEKRGLPSIVVDPDCFFRRPPTASPPPGDRISDL